MNYENQETLLLLLSSISEIEAALTLHLKCRSSTAKLANLVDFLWVVTINAHFSVQLYCEWKHLNYNLIPILSLNGHIDLGAGKKVPGKNVQRKKRPRKKRPRPPVKTSMHGREGR
jgi:hypothetical protein